MNESDRLEVRNLRAEVTLLQFVVAQLLKASPNAGLTLETAITLARASYDAADSWTEARRELEGAYRSLKHLSIGQ